MQGLASSAERVRDNMKAWIYGEMRECERMRMCSMMKVVSAFLLGERVNRFDINIYMYECIYIR